MLINVMVCRHDKLVMVSGGSGITPFMSIIREFIFMNSKMKCNTPEIVLICSFKNTSELAMLDLLVPLSDATYGNSNLELQIEAHVTRESGPPAQNPKPLQTIWFKPSDSDIPISPTLGKYSWLMLGAIISLSLIIFLLLIGLLTRFYIYPVDHNTYQVFSVFSKAMVNMLLLCTSIVVAASAAFVWNKRQSSKRMNQIQETSGCTDSGDKELESLPLQSLAKATKVHYGQRPNLKSKYTLNY